MQPVDTTIGHICHKYMDNQPTLTFNSIYSITCKDSVCKYMNTNSMLVPHTQWPFFNLLKKTVWIHRLINISSFTQKWIFSYQIRKVQMVNPICVFLYTYLPPWKLQPPYNQLPPPSIWSVGKIQQFH